MEMFKCIEFLYNNINGFENCLCLEQYGNVCTLLIEFENLKCL
jgi:hypothetical protein